MKNIIRYGLILGLISAGAGALLAIVNLKTKPLIIAQAKARERLSLLKVMPQGVNFEPVKAEEEIIYYKAFDKNGVFLGVAFKAEKRGYSSNVETIVGMSSDGVISSINLLSQNETPGLGNVIQEPFFTDRFKGKKIEEIVSIDAIVGATVSSKAVIEPVYEKAKEIYGLISK